jgi:RimJ/RimL family protein N-acetyltransferase
MNASPISEYRIEVRPGIYLSSFREQDKPALLEHLSTRDVYNTTLNIPYPYTEVDADFWIHQRQHITKRQGIEVTFAIREANGKLIGGIGADELELTSNNQAEPTAIISNHLVVSPRAHRVEFGYWLARPYWGQGIMTDAVRVYVRYAFTELNLLKLTAHVFAGNLASARVLEKNSFKLEGKLRQHFLKDGRLLDALSYGLLKEDWLNAH